MTNQSAVSVLFVCMGNICRSPTAEGVFRHLVEKQQLGNIIQTDSAGTHAYHVGEPPDRRAQTTATNRGIDISDLRARRVHTNDYEEFDYILAMDRDNLEVLISQSPSHLAERIHLFLDFADNHPESEVPDPYYGGKQGFERVFDMVHEAAHGLLQDIQARHLKP